MTGTHAAANSHARLSSTAWQCQRSSHPSLHTWKATPSKLDTPLCLDAIMSGSYIQTWRRLQAPHFISKDASHATGQGLALSGDLARDQLSIYERSLLPHQVSYRWQQVCSRPCRWLCSIYAHFRCLIHALITPPCVSTPPENNPLTKSLHESPADAYRI